MKTFCCAFLRLGLAP